MSFVITKMCLMSRNLFIATGIFHPESGGPATYLYELLPGLLHNDWQIRLLTFGDDATAGYPYPVERIPRRLLPLRQAHYALSARKYLSWADVVYSHTIDLPLMGQRRTPRIIKIVGDGAWERCIRKGWITPITDIDDFQHTHYSPIVSWQQQSRSRQVRAMDAVIVPSQYLKKMVMGWGISENKIHVIYNALPPAPENLPATQSAARQQLDRDERPVLLTAGRLTAWKGMNHLIGAMKALPEDVRLIIAGDGTERIALEAQAQGMANIEFMGKVPRETLYTMMRAADYFVLYSGYEGLPHTLLESLRMGTPVIASAKGGNVEVVRDGENGYLVPHVDVDALTDILRMALKPGQRDLLAASTSQGMERFAFARMLIQTHEVLSSYI